MAAKTTPMPGPAICVKSSVADPAPTSQDKGPNPAAMRRVAPSRETVVPCTACGEQSVIPAGRGSEEADGSGQGTGRPILVWVFFSSHAHMGSMEDPQA